MQADYYRGLKLLILNVAIGLGTFIQILDTSIANVAIPYIAGGLASSSDQATWVITSFAASNAIVLPLTGWLSNYFGQVRFFVCSVILFAITSFLCGFSESLTLLVIFRMLQGASAGALIPLSQTLIMAHNPPDKRGGALGFWIMLVVVAPICGPIISGYICEQWNWPWIFYINVPVGLLSALLTWSMLKDRESQIVKNPVDWTGLALLTIGVGSLQIMLDKGKDLDWFESNVIIALTVIAVVALVYFTAWNWFQRYPLIDFSLFRDRNFVIGTVLVAIAYLFFFGSGVVLPLWLQVSQHYTAFWAGVATAPIGLFPLLFSGLVGKNLAKWDARILSAASFLVFGASFYMQACFTSQVNLVYIMLVRCLQGIGVTIFFLPLVQISMNHMPQAKYASASGVFNFIRILLGSGFGVSLIIQCWSRLQVFHHGRLAEAITGYRAASVEAYQQLEASSGAFTQDLVNNLINTSVDQQAYMLATNDLVWFASIGFLLITPLPFLCKRFRKLGSAHASASE